MTSRLLVLIVIMFAHIGCASGGYSSESAYDRLGRARRAKLLQGQANFDKLIAPAAKEGSGDGDQGSGENSESANKTEPQATSDKPQAGETQTPEKEEPKPEEKSEVGSQKSEEPQTPNPKPQTPEAEAK